MILQFSDCFLTGSTFGTGSQVCEKVIPGLKDAYQCQERCRQCSECNFFAFESNAVPAETRCNLRHTNQNEVKHDPDGSNYIAGPKYCGNMSSLFILPPILTNSKMICHNHDTLTFKIS